MDAAELRIHRLNTIEFIKQKASTIVLKPVDSRERTASGGWIDIPGTDRAPQQLRIIELGTNSAPPVVRLADGQVREVVYWLLGPHDAQMAIGDTWTEGERAWMIGDIVRSNGYETRGVVVEHGR